MMVSLNRKKELRARVRSLQQELNKVSAERNSLFDEHMKRKYVNYVATHFDRLIFDCVTY